MYIHILKKGKYTFLGKITKVTIEIYKKNILGIIL